RVGDGEHDALLRRVLRVRLADGVAEERFGAGNAGAVGAAVVEGEACVVAHARTCFTRRRTLRDGGRCGRARESAHYSARERRNPAEEHGASGCRVQCYTPLPCTWT